MPPRSQPQSPELQAALRDTKSKARKVEKAFMTIQDFVETLVPPKIKHSMATFRPDMIKRNPNDQSQSALCQLPVEVLSMIFEWLTEPYDRVSLAVACKRTMGIFEACKTMLPRSELRVTFQSRLMILTQLHEWMPPNLRLCVACVRYLPRSTKHGQWWGDQEVERHLKVIARDPQHQDKIGEIDNLRETGSHCPRCALRRNFQYLVDKQACLKSLTNLKRDFEEHDFLPRKGQYFAWFRALE